MTDLEMASLEKQRAQLELNNAQLREKILHSQAKIEANQERLADILDQMVAPIVGNDADEGPCSPYCACFPADGHDGQPEEGAIIFVFAQPVTRSVTQLGENHEQHY